MKGITTLAKINDRLQSPHQKSLAPPPLIPTHHRDLLLSVRTVSLPKSHSHRCTPLIQAQRARHARSEIRARNGRPPYPMPLCMFVHASLCTRARSKIQFWPLRLAMNVLQMCFAYAIGSHRAFDFTLEGKSGLNG